MAGLWLKHGTELLRGLAAVPGCVTDFLWVTEGTELGLILLINKIEII